jgi:hypothetical protein
MWDGLEVIQYHLELSIVIKLARTQFNDLRVPGTSECSATQLSDYRNIQKMLSTYTKEQ